MEDALKKFTEYLAENSLKDTPQRRKIIEHFLESDEHYSAEEFYNYLQSKDVEVGQATVYRTLRTIG